MALSSIVLSLLASQAVPTQTRGTQKVPRASSRISHPVIDKSSSRTGDENNTKELNKHMKIKCVEKHGD